MFHLCVVIQNSIISMTLRYSMANERNIPGKYFIGYKLGFRSNTKTK